MRDETRFTEHETGNIHRPYFIMELRLTLWQELLISAAMMLVLISGGKGPALAKMPSWVRRSFWEAEPHNQAREN